MRIVVEVDVAAVIERLGGPRVVAGILGVAISTPYRWRHKGDMPARALFDLLSHLPAALLPSVLRVRPAVPEAAGGETVEGCADGGSGERPGAAGRGDAAAGEGVADTAGGPGAEAPAD